MTPKSAIARAGIAVAVAGVFTAAALYQAPASVAAQQVRDQRAAPPAAGPVGTGVIGGVVTSEDGSRPVRFAYLVLLGTGTGTMKVSATDADGRFAFANLPADRYLLGASKAPYLGTVAGARRPGRPGTPIAVADGQKVSNVTIRMPMGASIAGLITDERGQPATATSVTVQQLRMTGGERTLVSPQSTGPRDVLTDERGRYRFFGLMPGEYVVSAIRPSQFAARALTVTEVDAALRGGGPPPAAVPSASGIRYAPVFFPGTTRAVDAMPIALASGEDRVNVDFKLELVQTSRVDGMVVASDGQAVTTGSVTLLTTGQGPLRTIQNARITPEGRFSIQNVTPGPYAVVARGLAAAANQIGVANIEVAGADVLGLQLTLGPMMALSGRLQFRGAGVAPALAGRRIPVRTFSILTDNSPPTVSATDASGGFTITNLLPAAYVIGAPLSFGPTTDSMTWALESVMADGVDITDRPVAFMADALPKDLVVTYSDRYQELTGKLARADGTPVSEHTIIVFPEDKAYWVTGSRRIVTTRPGTDGRFTLSGQGPTTLPPGKYLLAAVTDIDRNEQFDPAFLAAIVPAAVPLTLQAGEKKVQDLIVK